jgi:rare lipoprotein A (peptidoglycan hydrolase)
VLLITLGLLAVPAVGSADSGGAGFASGSSNGTSTSTGTGTGGSGSGSALNANVQPGDVRSTVTSGGVTLTARISAILRHQVHFSGAVEGGSPGSGVAVQRFDATSGWVTVASTTVAADGTFAAVWRADHTGRLTIRAIPAAAASAARARRASASASAGTGTGTGAGAGASTGDTTTGTSTGTDSSTLNLTVYRPSIATTFGDGFFGQKTACGQTLEPDTLGVAHRTLKCGTKVAIYYHGRTIVVPVIDRGPYANHADWDLTDATARALGMDGTATIGAVPIRRAG